MTRPERQTLLLMWAAFCFGAVFGWARGVTKPFDRDEFTMPRG